MVRRAASYVDHDTQLQTNLWLKEIRSLVAPRDHLQLHPKQCVLLVVDMLRYFADPQGRCFLPASKAIIPHLSKLVSAWRHMGNPVIFTRHCHKENEDLGMLGRFFSDHIRCDEIGSHIIETLAPESDEPVVRKTTYDAFLHTDLESHFTNHKAKQVLVTGVLTHLCCETSARAAFCRGYEVYVAADGCASSNEALHVHSLLSMADGVAKILSTEEILEICKTHP